jgi:hypothetical protein
LRRALSANSCLASLSGCRGRTDIFQLQVKTFLTLHSGLSPIPDISGANVVTRYEKTLSDEKLNRWTRLGGELE